MKIRQLGKNTEISWKSVKWEKYWNFMKIRQVGKILKFQENPSSGEILLKFHENPSSGKNTEISWKSVKWEKYWNFMKIRQVGNEFF